MKPPARGAKYIWEKYGQQTDTDDREGGRRPRDPGEVAEVDSEDGRAGNRTDGHSAGDVHRRVDDGRGPGGDGTDPLLRRHRAHLDDPPDSARQERPKVRDEPDARADKEWERPAIEHRDDV